MPSILEIKDLGELMKRGWSYRSVGSGSIKGVYCWKKYVVFDDGRKAFNNFVISDSADTYPNNGSLDGYYYEPISSFPVLSATSVYFVAFCFLVFCLARPFKSILRPLVLLIANFIFVYSFGLNNILWLSVTLLVCMTSFISVISPF